MVTFPDLTKTDSIQVVWNWRLSFVWWKNYQL
jgi:hypothetical protein